MRQSLITSVNFAEFCNHPLRAGSAIANGRVLLEGSMGVYEYKTYISPVGYGRIVQFSCQQGYIRRGSQSASRVKANLRFDCAYFELDHLFHRSNDCCDDHM